MDSKLLPCPFCGGKPDFEHHVEPYGTDRRAECRGFSVYCSNCTLHFGTDNEIEGHHKDHTTGQFETLGSATKAWNTRTHPTNIITPEVLETCGEAVWALKKQGNNAFTDLGITKAVLIAAGWKEGV